MSPIKRKARIAWLNLRICYLRYAMSHEEGITYHWKRMARNRADLVIRRNALMTPAEFRKLNQGRAS